MKKQILLALCLLMATSCQKNTVDYYAFPDEINVNKDTCLEIWEDLELQINNLPNSKIGRYQVYAWFGAREDLIQTNPNKYDYSTDTGSFKFYVPRKELGSNGFIFFQLKGFASDKGYVGDSKIYKFKKIDTSGCVKWTAF